LSLEEADSEAGSSPLILPRQEQEQAKKERPTKVEQERQFELLRNHETDLKRLMLLRDESDRDLDKDPRREPPHKEYISVEPEDLGHVSPLRTSSPIARRDNSSSPTASTKSIDRPVPIETEEKKRIQIISPAVVQDSAQTSPAKEPSTNCRCYIS
jgi:hypothetical protein